MGKNQRERMMLNRIFSAGSPSFSYIAMKKAGSISAIIKSTAEELPMAPRVAKKTGTPIAAAAPKHTACLLVKPRMNFVLTRVRSLGIWT